MWDSAGAYARDARWLSNTQVISLSDIFISPLEDMYVGEYIHELASALHELWSDDL